MDFAHSHRPVTNAEYFQQLASGQNSIHNNLITIVGNELLNVLNTRREPWLWYAVVFGMNYDLEDSSEVAAWILDQDDCDALIAIAAFGAMGGPAYCANPDNQFGIVRPLEVIIERVGSRPYKQSVMLADGLSNVDATHIAAECEQALVSGAADGTSQVSMPAGLKELLMTPLNGKTPRVEYMVGEEGLWMVPVQSGHSIN
jgi:hypothetical protein